MRCSADHGGPRRRPPVAGPLPRPTRRRLLLLGARRLLPAVPQVELQIQRNARECAPNPLPPPNCAVTRRRLSNPHRLSESGSAVLHSVPPAPPRQRHATGAAVAASRHRRWIPHRVCVRPPQPTSLSHGSHHTHIYMHTPGPGGRGRMGDPKAWPLSIGGLCTCQVPAIADTHVIVDTYIHTWSCLCPSTGCTSSGGCTHAVAHPPPWPTRRCSGCPSRAQLHHRHAHIHLLPSPYRSRHPRTPRRWHCAVLA